jgi:selenocysteine-specific elongation factor
MSDRHIVFGTAGHVDHGKSSLVLALTGTDPDRWAEEKAREMTIDLGFAFLSLPGIDNPAALVDVPGHEMFVRNMVTGATGVDAAIFVVAADEGVMPQTVEHLEVLRNLRLSAGVIALTKADKVSPERLSLSRGEVGELVKGTFLEGAAMIPVSAVTGAGLEALREELARLAAQVTTRSAGGIFRLPIDRVFTIKGAGTVVTGTVASGTLKAGEKVECLPQGRLLRVRALHVQNSPVAEIVAGQRAAINLAEAEKQELQRGEVLATLGSLSPTLMLDARINLSERAAKPLLPRTRLRMHHGTNEVMARIVLLESPQLPPGNSELCQLRLESPLVGLAGDPFVLRSYSPMLVIGGGIIVDPHPPKRRKAAGAEEISQRETLPLEQKLVLLLTQAQAAGMDFPQLRARSGLSEDELHHLLENLEEQGKVRPGRRESWFSADALEAVGSNLLAALADLHGKEPLRAFVGLNALLAAMPAGGEGREGLRLALEMLVRQKKIVLEGNRLRLAGHQPIWAEPFAGARKEFLAELQSCGLAAPAPAELAAKAGLSESDTLRVLEALVEAGEVQLLVSGIYLHSEAVSKSRAAVIDFLQKHPQMSIAEARELLGASRKYLVPFLEQLDREGITLRKNEYRVAGRALRQQ